ncbi:MAG: hypothetical protein HQ517_18185, partial [SAR324 cluster bacterium]|nr:hypothetical protein [SAR324 cluster bacterium]
MALSEMIPANEDLIGFFLPHLTWHIETLVTVLSRYKKKDLSDAEWLIILNEKRSGKLLNHHFLNETWEEMASFLKGKTKLFYFLEEKQHGLVAQSYT